MGERRRPMLWRACEPQARGDLYKRVSRWLREGPVASRAKDLSLHGYSSNGANWPTTRSSGSSPSRSPRRQPRRAYATCAEGEQTPAGRPISSRVYKDGGSSSGEAQGVSDAFARLRDCSPRRWRARVADLGKRLSRQEPQPSFTPRGTRLRLGVGRTGRISWASPVDEGASLKAQKGPSVISIERPVADATFDAQRPNGRPKAIHVALRWTCRSESPTTAAKQSSW